MNRYFLILLLVFLPSLVVADGPQYEDLPALAGGELYPMGCKRVDSDTSQTSTDGDLTLPVCDTNGYLKVATTLSWSGSSTDPSKLEDAAHVTGDRGMAMLGIADDNTPSPTSGTAGDYVLPAISSFTGALQVSVTQSFQSSAGGGLLNLEDAAHASGDAGVAILGVRQDTPASSNADNDYGSLKLDGVGALWTHDRAEATEDAAMSAGVQTLVVGTMRNNTPAATTDTDGDVATLTSDTIGRLWVNPWAGTESSYTTVVAYAEGSITASYTTLVTNAAALKHLEIYNGTDTAMYISFDASTNHWFIPAASTKVFPYQQLGLKESSNVSIKYDTDPSTGTVYASAMY